MGTGWIAGEECGLPSRSRWWVSSSLGELFHDTHILYNKLCEQCCLPVQVCAQSFSVWVTPQSAGEWQISDNTIQSTPSRTGALLRCALWRLKGIPTELVGWAFWWERSVESLPQDATKGRLWATQAELVQICEESPILDKKIGFSSPEVKL